MFTNGRQCKNSTQITKYGLIGPHTGSNELSEVTHRMHVEYIGRKEVISHFTMDTTSCPTDAFINDSIEFPTSCIQKCVAARKRNRNDAQSTPFRKIEVSKEKLKAKITYHWR